MLNITVAWISNESTDGLIKIGEDYEILHSYPNWRVCSFPFTDRTIVGSRTAGVSKIRARNQGGAIGEEEIGGGKENETSPIQGEDKFLCQPAVRRSKTIMASDAMHFLATFL